MAVIPLLFVAGKSVQVPEEYLILLFKRPLYLRMMWNSLIITIPVLIGQLLLAPLAAYGFWQCRWKYKEILFYLYMIVMLMPLQLTLVPNYLVANWLGIQNSSLAIILPAMFQPLGVFLIRQQIQDFPQETLEAARLDGASEYRIYRSIVKPNPDKPEKLFLFSTPCVILKKKGVFICYSLINTLIKFMASLPVMTA